MKNVHLAAGLAALTTFVLAGAANAQQTNIIAPTTAPPAPAAAEQTTYVGPNLALITSGIVTFGVSYIPSVVVAAESPQSADHHLYIPLVGPWIDLGNRPGCGVSSIHCDTETTNKVLLVGDGIFQAAGVVMTVAGFLTPERREVVTTTSDDGKVKDAKADKPTIHFTPAQLASGAYGVAAFGKF